MGSGAWGLGGTSEEATVARDSATTGKKKKAPVGFSCGTRPEIPRGVDGRGRPRRKDIDRLKLKVRPELGLCCLHCCASPGIIRTPASSHWLNDLLQTEVERCCSPGVRQRQLLKRCIRDLAVVAAGLVRHIVDDARQPSHNAEQGLQAAWSLERCLAAARDTPAESTRGFVRSTCAIILS